MSRSVAGKALGFTIAAAVALHASAGESPVDPRTTPAETVHVVAAAEISDAAVKAEGPEGTGAVVAHRDRRYRVIDGVGRRAHLLDIFTPKNPEGCPVMVYVHGGGWRNGDKREVHLKHVAFVDRGFVFVSLNYRLAPGGRHPANVEDVAYALVWVHDNIEEYGGDPDCLFIMGHSAGAHLAALVATDERHLEKAGQGLGILKGVVALDTRAYDVTKLMARNGKTRYSEAFPTNPDTWPDASPIHHIAAGKAIPPFLIVYSSGMGLRPSPAWARAATEFSEALRAAGVEATVVDASDHTHEEIELFFGSTGDSVTERAMAFLWDLF